MPRAGATPVLHTWTEAARDLPCTIPCAMSEHTEQLDDLAERIAAARGFL